MIEKARARDIYDNLSIGDIETALSGRYDLVVAADTLVYLGDLSPVFAAVSAHLERQDFFCSPWKPGRARVLRLVPSAAGGMAKPICAKRPPKRALQLRA